MMLATYHGFKTIKCDCVQPTKPLIPYINNNYHLFIHLKMDRDIHPTRHLILLVVWPTTKRWVQLKWNWSNDLVYKFNSLDQHGFLFYFLKTCYPINLPIFPRERFILKLPFMAYLQISRSTYHICIIHWPWARAPTLHFSQRWCLPNH